MENTPCPHALVPSCWFHLKYADDVKKSLKLEMSLYSTNALRLWKNSFGIISPKAGWLRGLFFASIPNILTTHVPEAGAFVWSHAQTHQNHHNVPSSVTILSTFAHYVTYKFCSTSSATRVTLLSPPSIVRIVPHMDIPPNTDQWMTGRWQDKVLSRMFFFHFGTEMLIIQTTRTHQELYL